MKVEKVNSLPTELWYPYSRPGGTNVDQGTEGNQFDLAYYIANRTDYRRPNQVILGL